MESITSIFGPDFLYKILVGATKSTASMFWSIVTSLWSNYWQIILPIIGLWIVYEVITRNGSIHYNSKNGFSPTLNRVIGSGTYLLLQTIFYLILHFVFGDNIYTYSWTYILHVIIFVLTGFLLNLSGFWVYWKTPRF